MAGDTTIRSSTAAQMSSVRLIGRVKNSVCETSSLRADYVSKARRAA